jgi:hypothetical protein
VIVLDTNVISELMRKDAAAEGVAWVDRHPGDQVFITAMTAAELLYGVTRLPNGRRKQALAAKVRDLIDVDFEDQVQRLGKPISMADAQIAAICRQYDLALGTRNTKNFADTGIRVLNPWD